MTISLQKVASSLTSAFQLLRKNDPLILSASTAFFTTFSLSPILIILTDLLTPVLGKENVQKELFSKIQAALGTATAKDVQTIVEGFKSQEVNTWITIAATLFFYFIATTLLDVVKQAMHQLWSIKKKATKKIMYSIKERLTGIGIIFLVALLTYISYLIDTFQSGLQREGLFLVFVSSTSSLLIVAIWFSLLFKFLPEARIAWKVALTGGIFTGIFFEGGAFLLGKILIHKNIAMIFGVSSSMAMILLFIFYCSFILYLGACFTYEFAKVIRKPILPGKYAIEFTEQVKK